MADISSLSIRSLKSALTAYGIRHDDCTEKAELVERLTSARRSGGSKASTPAVPPPRPAASAAPPQPSMPSADDTSAEANEVRRVLKCTPTAYYGILGCAVNATDGDLKKAYRKLAMRLHPDKCHVGGADEAFKRVGAAFAVLSDQKKRTVHDLSGGDAANEARHARGETTAATTPHRGSPHGSAFRDSDAEELFRAFFGADAAAYGDGANHTTNHPTAVVQRVAGLASRLAKTFVENPWTLITALSALASLVSVLESLAGILGKYTLIALPAAGCAIVTCPPQQRRHLGALALVLLCSGWLI